MAISIRKTTLYLDQDLHKKLRILAIQQGKTLKQLVNDALRIAILADPPKSLSAEKLQKLLKTKQKIIDLKN